MSKRLYRSRRERMISGVCGGIAEYFAFDPTIVRLITVLVGVLSVVGWIPLILAYFIAVIIVPEN